MHARRTTPEGGTVERCTNSKLSNLLGVLGHSGNHVYRRRVLYTRATTGSGTPRGGYWCWSNTDTMRSEAIMAEAERRNVRGTGRA